MHQIQNLKLSLHKCCIIKFQVCILRYYVIPHFSYICFITYSVCIILSSELDQDSTYFHGPRIACPLKSRSPLYCASDLVITPVMPLYPLLCILGSQPELLEESFLSLYKPNSFRIYFFLKFFLDLITLYKFTKYIKKQSSNSRGYRKNSSNQS